MEAERVLVGNQTFNHTVIHAFRSWNPGSLANKKGSLLSGIPLQFFCITV
jgi:hypothetical protein